MGGKGEITVVLVTVCISLADTRGASGAMLNGAQHTQSNETAEGMCVGKKKIQLLELELGQNTFTNTSIHEKKEKKVILNDHK